jgi:hypothetical protein
MTREGTSPFSLTTTDKGPGQNVLTTDLIASSGWVHAINCSHEPTITGSDLAISRFLAAKSLSTAGASLQRQPRAYRVSVG